MYSNVFILSTIFVLVVIITLVSPKLQILTSDSEDDVTQIVPTDKAGLTLADSGDNNLTYQDPITLDPNSTSDSPNSTSEPENEHERDSRHTKGVHVISWGLERVWEPLSLCIILLLAIILKVIFHYMDRLSAVVPESCLLILFGVLVGAIMQCGCEPGEKPGDSSGLKTSSESHTNTSKSSGSGVHLDPESIALHPDLFMLYLLPPIVLDSAYSLNDRVVFNNLGTILLFAVVGTIANFLIIGPALYGIFILGGMGPDPEHGGLTLMECLVFASMVVAVDPVAVLAIFQDVGVNRKLYFLVFGESLLNDAVTIVLYSMMLAFEGLAETGEEISWEQILTGVASFFTISLGAASIGFVYGFFSAIITKFLTKVRVAEPMVILVLAYMSYITAELFHWSGIISMIVCGVMQAEYALQNIHRKSCITVKYFVKMVSSISDVIIFMFLGLELIRTDHEWHLGFICWSLVLCLVVRFATTIGLSGIVNYFSTGNKISFRTQIIMWYGGLRGAVAFALCATLPAYEGDENSFHKKELFLTSVLVVIMFTVFGQGITIKPLVKLCGIERAQQKSKDLTTEFQCHVNDHLMAGIEGVIGQMGDNRFRMTFTRINDKYIRRVLQKDPMTQDQKILQQFQKVVMKDHQQHIYESTAKTVTLKDNEDDVVMPDNADNSAMAQFDDNKSFYKEDFEPDMRKRGSIKVVEIDDHELNRKLSIAINKSAMSSSPGRHPSMNDCDDNDMLDALMAKHARTQANHRIRRQSTLQPRRRSSVSRRSSAETAAELSHINEGFSPDSMPQISVIQEHDGDESQYSDATHSESQYANANGGFSNNHIVDLDRQNSTKL